MIKPKAQREASVTIVHLRILFLILWYAAIAMMMKIMAKVSNPSHGLCLWTIPCTKNSDVHIYLLFCL